MVTLGPGDVSQLGLSTAVGCGLEVQLHSFSSECSCMLKAAGPTASGCFGRPPKGDFPRSISHLVENLSASHVTEWKACLLSTGAVSECRLKRGTPEYLWNAGWKLKGK